MRCCAKPHLMDEQDPCGCKIEACFSCNEYRYIVFCSEHEVGANE